MLKTPTRLLVPSIVFALLLASCGETQLDLNDVELPRTFAEAESYATTEYAPQNRPDVRGQIGAGNMLVLLMR